MDVCDKCCVEDMQADHETAHERRHVTCQPVNVNSSPTGTRQRSATRSENGCSDRNMIRWELRSGQHPGHRLGHTHL